VCAAGGYCSFLEREYSQALAQARVCTIGAPNQCAFKVSSTLACPGCIVHVNSVDNLNAVRQRWTASGCSRCARICPRIICLEPGTPTCALLRPGPVTNAEPTEPADPAPGVPAPLPPAIIPPPLPQAQGVCLDGRQPLPL
jgi:hypothetical protein